MISDSRQDSSTSEDVFRVAVHVRQDELATWSPERLSVFFNAVNVLMMAKTQPNIPAGMSATRTEAGHGQAAELHEIESRMAERLRQHEGVLVEMQRTAAGTLDALRGELATARERVAAEPVISAGSGRALNHIGDSLDVVEQRIKRIEQVVDGVRRHVATLHESIAEDFKSFEDNLAAHNAAILSARSAMSQTDDLVERVVEALEVLQTSSIPSSDESAVVSVN